MIEVLTAINQSFSTLSTGQMKLNRYEQHATHILYRPALTWDEVDVKPLEPLRIDYRESPRYGIYENRVKLGYEGTFSDIEHPLPEFVFISSV
jgi:hypothetical protein